MHETKISVLCINTCRFHPYLVCGLARVSVCTRPMRQHIRLIDILDYGRLDNIPGIPRLSTKQKLEQEVWLPRVVECQVPYSL